MSSPNYLLTKIMFANIKLIKYFRVMSLLTLMKLPSLVELKVRFEDMNKK